MKLIQESFKNLNKKNKQFFTKERTEIVTKLNKQISNNITSIYQDNLIQVSTRNLDNLKAFKNVGAKVISPLIKIGTISQKINNQKKQLPLFLPIEMVNALCVYDTPKGVNPTDLFQTIALRMMLSLSMDLQKYYFIDTDFGRGYSKLSNIDDAKFNNVICTKTDEIKKAINDLYDIVVQANTSFLSNNPSIRNYNEQTSLMLQPYHFLFINNFPNGFSQDDADILFRLIKDGNGARAGIHIFLSIDKNYNLPYGGIDIEAFRQMSCQITFKKNKYNITNYPLDIGEFKEDIHIDFKLPTKINTIIKSLNETKIEEKILNFEKEIEILFNKSGLWKENSKNGFRVPVGYISEQELHYFEFGGKTTDFFALIGGLPGYGKTIFLHSVIIGGALNYSPEEIKYFLVDCKNGTSFNLYKNLPHVEVLAISDERDYAKSILEYIEDEMEKRANLFKSYSAPDYKDYRTKSQKKLPRIILIIDEFQVLLEKMDRMSGAIENMLEKIIRLGRSFGINMILCTQGLGSLTFNPNNVSRRYAFNLTAMESDRIVRNEGATKLLRPGNAIMNNSQDGDKTNNVRFQAAYLDDKIKLGEYIDKISKLTTKTFGANKFEQFISDGTKAGKITKNTILHKSIISNDFKINDNFCTIFLGEPSFVEKQHTHLIIRKQSKSNLLLLGNDEKTAVNLISITLFQLIKQSSSDSEIYIFDYFNINNQYKGYYQSLVNQHQNITLVGALDDESAINDIHNKMSKRMEDAKNRKPTSGRIILCFLSFQNAENLKEQNGAFGKPDVTNKLFEILGKGPNEGIHSIIYSLNHSGLMEIFEYNTINNFENKIALYGSDTDSILKNNTEDSKINSRGLGILEAQDTTKYGADLFKAYELPQEYQSTKSRENKNIEILQSTMKN